MSISAEERNRYLRETAIVLAREGFRTDRTDTGKLRVLLDGAPLCEVTESGGITYHNEDAGTAGRSASLELDAERCDHGGGVDRRGTLLVHPAGYCTESIQVGASAND